VKNSITVFEFLEEEAAREGKTATDIMIEIAEDTARDNQRMEEILRQNEKALSTIKDFTDNEYFYWLEYSKDEDYVEEPEPIRPSQVLEVLEVRYNQSYGGSSIFLLAKVLCMDGIERIAEFNYSCYFATWHEPGSEDGEILWHNSLEEYHSGKKEKKL